MNFEGALYESWQREKNRRKMLEKTLEELLSALAEFHASSKDGIHSEKTIQLLDAAENAAGIVLTTKKSRYNENGDLH